ncbi:MAG: hypothetical protein HC893_04555 [Chloroflexaceae bacterium]|nr:hypothetical protein [Chloroflexaceae bacterium]NJL33251.1 hypothetical protein [Chloroflexaceae bacterium]NJO04773.1 hypothetical protein [Chloroflexaceae bacterium]
MIRTIFLVLITFFFFRYAQRAGAGSNRRRAFTLAGIATSLFAVLNLLALTGVDVSPLVIPISLLAVIGLSIAVFFLIRGWQRGEMHEQLDQMRQLFDTKDKQ